MAAIAYRLLVAVQEEDSAIRRLQNATAAMEMD